MLGNQADGEGMAFTSGSRMGAFTIRKRFDTIQFTDISWHDFIADGTLADAIQDRLVHNAYKINLKGESMRKWYAKKDDHDNRER